MGGGGEKGGYVVSDETILYKLCVVQNYSLYPFIRAIRMPTEELLHAFVDL